jgi:hypothetical protein
MSQELGLCRAKSAKAHDYLDDTREGTGDQKLRHSKQAPRAFTRIILTGAAVSFAERS